MSLLYDVCNVKQHSCAKDFLGPGRGGGAIRLIVETMFSHQKF